MMMECRTQNDTQQNNRRSQRRQIAIAYLAFASLLGCSSDVDSDRPGEPESVWIPLDRSVLREPLATVVLPKRPDQQSRTSRPAADDEPSDAQTQNASDQNTTRDRVTFNSDGMLITQPANPDAAGRASGLKVQVPATGDFELRLKCAIRRLEQPTVPQGAHGLSLRFVFEDGEPGLVVFGCMSSSRCERCLVKRVKYGDDKPEQTMAALDFSKGFWTVRRQDSTLSLTVESDDGQVVATETVDGVSGRLGVTEIWCSRLPKGNAHAEVLLGEVSMSAAELFPSEKEPSSWLPWIRWTLLAVVITLAALVYRSRR